MKGGEMKMLGRMRTRVTAGEVQYELDKLRQEVADGILVYHNQVLVPYMEDTIRLTRAYRPIWLRVVEYFKTKLYRRRLRKRLAQFVRAAKMKEAEEYGV